MSEEAGDLKNSAKGNKAKSNHPALGTKVSDDILEKRRLGRVRAAEEFQKRVVEAKIVRHDDFKLFNSNAQPTNVLSFKYFSTDFAKKDDQLFTQREKKQLITDIKEGKNIDLDDREKENNVEVETIVIDCGSRVIKCGRPDDEEPLYIASMVATLKREGSNPENEEVDILEDLIDNEEYIQSDTAMRTSLQERMRYYKKKFNPVEGRKEVLKYNTSQQNKVEKIKSDIKRPKWKNHSDICDVANGYDKCKCYNKVYCGNDAALLDTKEYNIRSPFKNLLYNVLIDEYYSEMSDQQKHSLQQLLSDDLYHLMRYLLKKTEKNPKSKKKVLLIIPDLHHKETVETLVDLMFKQLGVFKIALMTQSQSIAYGTSISQPTTCVDIGHTTTKITTLFEGLPIKNSSINVNFGSEQVANLFANYMKNVINFPIQIDMNLKMDRWFVQQMCEKYLTFDEGNLAVQLYTNCIKYDDQDALIAYKTDFKIFEEVFLAGMGMFYADIFKVLDINRYSKKQVNLLLNKDRVDEHGLNSIANYTASKASKRFSDQQTDEDVLKLAMELKLDDLKEKVEEDDEEDEDEDEDEEDDEDDEDDEDAGKKHTKGNDEKEQKADKEQDRPEIVTKEDVEDAINNDIEEEVELNYCPLDKAIVQSILTSVVTSDLPIKIKELYNNIILVGGGSNIPNLDMLLIDRLTMNRPGIFSTNYLSGILSDIEIQKENQDDDRSVIVQKALENYYKLQEQSNNLRDQLLQPNKKQKTSNADSSKAKKIATDEESASAIVQEAYTTVRIIPLLENVSSSNVCFRGGSIYASIKLIDEMYVSKNDWDLVGPKVFRYKCIFDY
ncbi:hypothetical protein FOG51_03078 [Hanseniaspora uvarum]|nr:hypothetical protein FOG51_03078 [Hanseniaspora uvarum]